MTDEERDTANLAAAQRDGLQPPLLTPLPGRWSNGLQLSLLPVPEAPRHDRGLQPPLLTPH